MMPSPDDLKYFLEAASALNFSRASERLGISQPSLSLAIRRVEESLGEIVFLRSKKGVALTQAGKQLLVSARGLIDAWEDIRTRAAASTHVVRGRFTVGCHQSVALYSLNLFLPKILKEHKDLEIKLVHDLSRKITDDVISSKVDLGIVVNPTRHPDLLIIKLYDDDVGFWARDIKNSKPTLSDDQVLIFDPALQQIQTLLQKAGKAGYKPKRTIESSSLEVVTDLTASGCGIGLLPTSIANRAAQKLVRIPGTPVFKDEICVVIRNESRNVAGIKCLTDAIKASLKY